VLSCTKIKWKVRECWKKRMIKNKLVVTQKYITLQYCECCTGLYSWAPSVVFQRISCLVFSNESCTTGCRKMSAESLLQDPWLLITCQNQIIHKHTHISPGSQQIWLKK
jgi:hypothetical protein